MMQAAFYTGDSHANNLEIRVGDHFELGKCIRFIANEADDVAVVPLSLSEATRLRDDLTVILAQQGAKP